MIAVQINRGNHTIQLGRQGENNARQSTFDISDWVSEFGEGVAALFVIRPGEKEPYVANINQSGNSVEWLVSAGDVEILGKGEAQLSYIVGDVVVRSEIWITSIERSLPQATGETPSPQQGLLDKIALLAKSAENFAKQSGTSATAAKQSEIAAGEYTVEAQRAAVESKEASAESFKNKEAIANMGAKAETIPYGQPAQVIKTVSADGTITLRFKIPQGQRGLIGATPNIQGGIVTVRPGNEPATVTRRPGSPDEAPILDFDIPIGDIYFPDDATPSNLYKLGVDNGLLYIEEVVK